MTALLDNLFHLYDAGERTAVNLVVGDLDPRNAPALGLDSLSTFAEQIEAVVEITRDEGTKLRLTLRSGRR